MTHIETNAEMIAGRMQTRERRVAHAKPAFAVIAQRLRSAVLKNFRQEGWFPERWAKSAAAAKRGGKTLSQRRTLANSMHPASGETFAKVGSDVVYAAIHQYGGTCGRNHATDLPARPFLPIDGSGNLERGLARRIRRTYEVWIAEGRLV